MFSLFRKNYRKIIENYYINLNYIISRILTKQNYQIHNLEPIYKRYFLNLVFHISRLMINKIKSILGISNFYLIKINNKENLKSNKNLLIRDSKYKIQAPYFLNFPEKFYKGNFKKIFAHNLKEVFVSPYSSSILKKNNLYINDIIFNNPLKFGLSKSGLLLREYPFIDDLIFFKKKFNLLIKKKLDYLKVEEGLLIGGCGSQNWYHWLIECLPKLYLVEKLTGNFSSFPLILPDICRTNNNFKESLIPFNIKNRKIIYIKENQIIYVKSLVTFDDVSICPFQLKKGAELKINNYSFHGDILLKYSQKFYEYADIDSKKNIKKENLKRIFLARKNSERSYNQDQLLSIAKKYDFEPVYLEDLTFKEQINLISYTSHIIGPSGAAWSCLIFNNKNKIKGLSWLPDYLAEACNYSSLAYFLGHKLRFIRYDRNYNKNKNFNFHTDFYKINEKIFEKGILDILRN